MLQPDPRLHLPTVTLCAATSVNVAATLSAMEASLRQVRFGACKLLTDRPVQSGNPLIAIVPIERLRSAEAYSKFVLQRLPDFVHTEHCMIVQWDGHVLDASRWLPDFLDYDYIGASWPQFADDYHVGNGGFSLRSKRLMSLCQAPDFVPAHPEDIAVGRIHRARLERSGMRFAPRGMADIFSAERSGDPASTFGFHGVWNMPAALGREAFWRIYCELDDKSSLSRDFRRLVWSVMSGHHGLTRAGRMVLDRLREAR